MQKLVSRERCDQQAAAEQRHQRVGLALKPLRQGHTADLHVVAALGENGLDAGIDMLEVRLPAAGKFRGLSALGNELQPGGSGEGTTAGLQQNQVVVGAVAAVEIAAAA